MSLILVRRESNLLRIRFRDNLSIELLYIFIYTYLTHFAYSRKGNWTTFLLSEPVYHTIWMHIWLIPWDSLSYQHLNDPYHASPSNILALLQPPIRKPDDFLECIVKLISAIFVVVVPKKIDLVMCWWESKGSARWKRQLEDTVILDVVC